MAEALEISSVSKSYGATKALVDVSFSILPGELHAIVGENGAGKSTLINILSGVTLPDEGSVKLGSQSLQLRSTQSARAAGIATVFQELSLAEALSVEENICAGREPARLGLIDRGELRRRAEETLQKLGVSLQPQMRVALLSQGQRQAVEIAKAIDLLTHGRTAADPGLRLLVLDEPTSALSADEKHALFRAVRALRDNGTRIIYISHHLDEVLDLADRITVLRDGRLVWTKPARGITNSDLVRAMVGRDIARAIRKRSERTSEAARFDAVGKSDQLTDVSFTLHHGEILAVAGLDGSGRECVGRLLSGIEKPDAGSITLKGAPCPANLIAAMARGLAYVPDDRKTKGLFLTQSIADNVSAADLDAVSSFGFVSNAKTKAMGAEVIERYGVKTTGPAQSVGALSGGNQQKVLLGKMMRRKPSVLVVEEPTKGVDISAKGDIHHLLAELAAAGAAVLVVSSDLPEILELADRILVLHRGRLAEIVEAVNASEERVMALASGVMQASQVQLKIHGTA
jgi:ABC-type sugar transport system ATPase subunit